MTAGTATNSPIAVMMSASPTGPATLSMLAWPAMPMPTSAFRMPHTVPNRPTKGAVEPAVVMRGGAQAVLGDAAEVIALLQAVDAVLDRGCGPELLLDGARGLLQL